MLLKLGVSEVGVLRKVATMILVVLLLTSCSGKSAPDLPQREPTLKESVSMLSFPEQNRAWLEECIDQAGLDFNVEILEVPQNQYENKVHMMLMGNEATDLILMDTPNIASYAVTGLLEPLDSHWNYADFADLSPAIQNAVQWEEHVWAAPLNDASCILFYNKKLLAEAGVAPAAGIEDAWDIHQFLDAAQKLTKRDHRGNIIQYGIQPSMFAPNNKNEGMTFTQMLFIWWFGGDVLSPDGTTASGWMDSEQSIAALKFYGDLYTAYQVAPMEEMAGGFETGKIAMWISGPWMLGIWKDSYPDFYKDGWGAMPLPRGERQASPTGSWNIAITRQSKDKEKAWQVVQALTGKEGMRLWCVRTGNIPARKSVWEEIELFQKEPIYRLVSQQLEHTAIHRPVTPAYPEISDAISTCFNSVAYGQDARLAAQHAVVQMNQALSDFDVNSVQYALLQI